MTLQGNDTQTNANGGFFNRGYGRRLTFLGKFRHFRDHLRNLGISYSINSEGVCNMFLKQELEKLTTEPKLFGLHVTWVFEEENGGSVDLTDDSYFYVKSVEST